MKKHLPLAIWLVTLVVIAGALLWFESDLLWKVQQKNLFLCSTLFLKEQLVVPGGLLSWVGAWFTQFLYYPWLGVLLLCGWWLLLMVIIKRAFRIPDRWAVLMLIPVAILLINNVDQGYWVYILKLRGHFFVATIGTTAIAALLWGFRCIPGKYYLRTVCIFLTCAIGYPLMGIYALAAALLMAIWSWRLSGRMEAIASSLVAILSVAAVPLLCYRYVYYQVNLANIFWAELPLFFVTENHPTYYIPYYMLALFFVVLAIMPPKLGGGRGLNKRTSNAGSAPHLPNLEGLWTIVVAVMLVGSVYTFWMKDENFHHELTMQHRIADLDWMGVLEEAATQNDEPTRAIVMMRNLALSRIGQQGDYQFVYKNGSKEYASPFGMRLMLLSGAMIYYQYGMLNYSNRLCMEMGVEFGFRTEDYQLLVNCAILEDDQPLARKYIGILKQTLFYRDWAEQAEALLGHPELIAKNPELEPITHMLHYNNYLGSDQGYTERFLMTQLSKTVYTDDPVFQEQTLLATLWTRNVEQFWYHFYEYIKLHPNAHVPRYYQEAAYLYGKMGDRTDLDQMPFDASVKDSFERFATSMTKYDGKDVREARNDLYIFYGDTYYYDYYTMSNLQEY